MTQTELEQMTVDELVERFIAIGLDQDRAIFEDNNAKFNVLYSQMEAVRNELKSRPGDQRIVLRRLFHHPNLQVRLKAATTTLSVAPEPSRQLLRSIADSMRLPQSADAGFILQGLADGTFVPE